MTDIKLLSPETTLSITLSLRELKTIAEITSNNNPNNVLTIAKIGVLPILACTTLSNPSLMLDE
jgi:hypothetical protein